MSGLEVVQFLTHLAMERKVAAATQGIALNALAFLYNKFKFESGMAGGLSIV